MKLIGTLAREYKWPPETIRALPLAQALCYQAEIMEHYRLDENTPTFAERDILKKL